ncbi:MAG TPA: TlpA disulfide reductase family protein, partial [Rhodanobacteraceae bacterium]|nr:TlpA disulfide reductase family protein [Rhodanobacteraceae bacterium]
VSVGPLLFPVGVIAILLGWLAASAVAAFLRKRGQADAAPMLWWLLLLALVVARAVFVTRWWSAYLQSPWWTIVDIRDRGFNVVAGCVALVMATLVTMHRRPDLKRSLPAAVAGGFAAAALTVLVASQLQATSHPPLSAATLYRLDGSPTTLTALSGKPMVINLWATWCPPCRAEMPMLVQASHAMPGVRFVFVDQGESGEAVQAFLERERLSPQYTLLDADNVLSRDYRALGYPTTLFVDADGRLRDTQVGPLSRATLESHLLRITSDSTQETPAP